MHAPSPSDFNVDVEGIGRFVFPRRTMRDEMKIAVEFSRLTEGEDVINEWLKNFAGAMAALKVLTVEAPDGWDIETMDPLDEATYDRLMKVYYALRAKEFSFRQGNGKGGQTGGQGSGGDAAVLVSPEVQPSSE